MTGTEGGPMYLLRGNGRGGFHRGRLLGNDLGQVEAVAVGRFNPDHLPDIAELVTGQRTSVRVLLGTGRSHFRPTSPTPSPRGTLQVADIDGDGRLDALVSGANRRTHVKRRATDVHIFPGTGDGTFSAGRTLKVCRNRELVRCSPSVRAVGDVDGDRRPDLALSTADARGQRPVVRVLVLRNRTR
jgi:hypothetical protein